MAWPLSQDYNEAIQSPAGNFADPELRHGEAVCNALGIPMPYSGNFADVYQVRCPGGARWAVKCFTRQAEGLRERYQEISKHLQMAKLPFTVDFTYLEKGIRVAGAWYPVLKMQWVEGLTLNQFVAQYVDKPAMLGVLSQVWGRMAQHLRAAEVGHCDLQHGNVLLVPGAAANSVALKLIDYDGMWAPTLAGKKSGEVGHPSYQHPQRLREATYCMEVDRFPLLLVATALRALKAKGKALWDKYDNGDNLLFTEADLRDPGRSALFQELPRLGDPLTAMLAARMVKALGSNLEAAPLLEEVLPDVRPAATPAPTRAARPTFTPPPSSATMRKAAPVTAVVGAAPAPAPAADDALSFDASPPGAVVSSVRKKASARGRPGGLPVSAWVGAGVAVVVFAAIAVGLAAWMLSGSPNQPTPQPPDHDLVQRDGPPSNPKTPPQPGDAEVRPPMPSPADMGLPVTDGLELCLDAAALNAARRAKGKKELEDGGKVDIWYDISGRGRDLGQTNLSCRPTFSAGKGGPAVVFDGVRTYLSWTGRNPGFYDATVVLVAAPGGNPGDFRGFLAMNATGKNDYESGLNVDLGHERSDRFARLNVEGAGFGGEDGKVLNDPSEFGRVRRLAVVSAVGQDVRVYVDGNRIGSRRRDPASVMRMDELYLGCRCAGARENLPPHTRGYLSCAVLEALVYGRELRDEELQKLDDYLAARHANATPIPPPGGPAGTDLGSKPPAAPEKGQPSPPQPAEAAKPEKAAVPDGAALADALKKVKDAYKTDTKRKPDELQKLVDKMIPDALDTKDAPAVRFAILREARDQAAKAGDLDRCLRAAAEIADHFTVGAREEKAAALEVAERVAPNAGARLSVAEHALAAEDEAQDADDYETAVRLVHVAQEAAGASGNKFAESAAQGRSKEVEACREAYKSAAAPAHALETKPDDADASLALGKFYCLEKGDWDRGLPLLAAGGDAKLKELARRDLAGAADGDGLAALGDAYKAAAEAENGPARTRLLERAWCWYQVAAAKLTGFPYKEMKGRADEVEKLLPPQQRPVVLYAKWGADSGWIDVTDRVRGLLVRSPGQKAAFRPGDIGIPSDPAPGKPKALVVVYRYRGWVFLSTTGEGDAAAVPAGFGPLDTPPGAPKSGQDLTILHARYGADNGWEQKTANAQERVLGGTMTAMPGDLGFGDPAFGKAKAMVLVYRNGGKVRLSITGQGDRASIGAPAVNP